MSSSIFQSASAWPLKVSENKRYFVDQNGVPVLLNGDTPWSLIGQVSREDADFYLQDRRNKGVNSLIVTLVETFYTDNAPANHYNVRPFTAGNKLSTPNDAYFQHADWVINKAAEYGFNMILCPMYMGCSTDGFYNQLVNDNTVNDCRLFGEYIGNRYKNFPNIIWVQGGDRSPDNNTIDKLRAIAQGIKSKDPNHLMTYHGSATSAVECWNWDPVQDSWLNLNCLYTYDRVWAKALQDYNRTPTMVFFLFEAKYEHECNVPPCTTTLLCRSQAYHAVLCGGSGHHYGNKPIWFMNGRPGDDSDSWKNHLNDIGAATLFPNFRKLFSTRAWYKLVPDQNHTVLTAGYSSEDTYAACAHTSDGITVMAYIPTSRQVTIDMAKVAGTKAKCWWYNPRDGSNLYIGQYATTGTKNFAPPDSNDDWVLVLDDASKNLPAPGIPV